VTSPSSAESPTAGYLVLAGIILFALGYAGVAIYRHHGLNSSGLDLAMYYQVLWNTGRGHLFETSIEVGNFLGDHVTLIALPLSTVTWVPRFGVETALLAQCLAIALTAWPIYRLAARETKAPWVAAALALAFLVHPTPGFTARFDFHYVAFCAAPLMWMIERMRAGRLGQATIAAAIALCCREEVGIAVAAVAFVATWESWSVPNPRRRAWCAGIAAGAVLWSVLAVAVVIPYFRGGASDTLQRYAWLGSDPGEMLRTLLLLPGKVWGHLAADPIRRTTVWYLLWPLALLPLGAPLRLLAVVPPLLICLLPDHPSQNSIYFHYLSPVLPIVWWAAIGGATRCVRLIERLSSRFGALAGVRPTMLVAAVAGCCLSAFAIQPPTSRTIEYPYWHVQVHPPRANRAAFAEARRLVGPSESVAATMALAPHFAERRRLAIVGWSSTLADPDVVCLDVTDFRWFERTPGYAGALVRLVESPARGVVYWRDGIAVLRRGAADAFPREAIVEAIRRTADPARRR
jgi:uncharacterized membrane protein